MVSEGSANSTTWGVTVSAYGTYYFKVMAKDAAAQAGPTFEHLSLRPDQRVESLLLTQSGDLLDAVERVLGGTAEDREHGAFPQAGRPAPAAGS